MSVAQKRIAALQRAENFKQASIDSNGHSQKASLWSQDSRSLLTSATWSISRSEMPLR